MSFRTLWRTLCGADGKIWPIGISCCKTVIAAILRNGLISGCHVPHFLSARWVPLTYRLMCRLPVDQIFKLPFLFLNFWWKHFVILFPYCFGHELQEQHSTVPENHCVGLTWWRWMQWVVSGNLIVRKFVSLFFWQVSAVEAHGLLLFHRLCVVQWGCTEPVCSNPFVFVLWCPEEEYLEGILWWHKTFSLPPPTQENMQQRSEAFMDVFFPFVFKASQCYGQLLIAKQLRRSGLKQMAQKWQKLVKADGSLKIF